VPKSAWADENEYTSTAHVLVQKFQDNFKQYDQGDEIVKKAGPTIN
jgi:ATP-dependent phosphoenolpyruvate carboxykinase